MRTRLALLALALGLAATPALARPAPENDSNHHWLDYKTDVSEAKRELRKDLARANDAGDRNDAWTEYRRELADARADYRKEMIERGYSPARVRRGIVYLERD